MSKVNRTSLVRAITIFLLLVVIVGCQSMTPSQRSALGTVLGGAVGGLVGNQFGSGTGKIVATAVGAGLGAFIGNQLASYLNKRQQQEVSGIVNKQLDDRVDRAHSETWRSRDAARSVEINTSEGFNRNQLPKIASNRKVELNSERASSLPSNTVCRYNTNRVSVHDTPQAQQGTLYCRTNQGNWVPVGSRTVVAQNN